MRPLERGIDGGGLETDVLGGERQVIRFAEFGLTLEPEPDLERPKREEIEPLHHGQNEPDERPPLDSGGPNEVDADEGEENGHDLIHLRPRDFEVKQPWGLEVVLELGCIGEGNGSEVGQ